ncbi:MAG TPA: cytochrome P450 [Acidimicrobiales bacterium]
MKPTQTLRVDEINLSDEQFWMLPPEEREGAFKTLREERPLAFFEEPVIEGLPPGMRGEGYVAVTRHADILEASRQPDVFSSAQGATNIFNMPPEFLEFFGSMINLDDPRHARLRRIVSAGFTPKMLKQVEDSVQRVAAEIVDRVIDRGECDFVTEVAARLPLQIICDMMGVPASHHDTIFHKSNIILSMGDPEYIPEGADVAATLLEAGAELSQLVQDLGSHRREHPTDDLTSALVNASVDGEHLDQAELGSFFILLVVAGNETTRNAISHALHQLSEHPDQQASWANDFDALAPTAVEEVVRWASPVIWMRRTTTRPTTLGGQALDEGTKLLLFYNSANRDDAVFDDPFTFDLRRTPNDHVGFGGPGPHFCLGSHLARREISVMWRELLRRVPDIHATDEPDRLRSSFINGIKHLPCAFTPGGR